MTGRVTTYHGIPQIEVSDPGQIVIADAASQVARPTATAAPTSTSAPTNTPDPFAGVVFAPQVIEDLLPELEMFVGRYTVQTSTYMTHDRLEAMPGFVDGVGVSYNLDVTATRDAQKQMLVFGVLCFEFETPESAEAGFDELIDVLNSTSSIVANEVEIDPLPVLYKAYQGTLPISAG